MSRGVPTLRVDATLAEARGVFARSQAEVIPVVARDASGWMRRYVGVVTRADLLKRLLGRRSVGLLRRTVAEVVRDAPRLAPDASLAAAAQRLLGSALPALAVVDEDGAVRGVLSLGDVLLRPLGESRSCALASARTREQHPFSDGA